MRMCVRKGELSHLGKRAHTQPSPGKGEVVIFSLRLVVMTLVGNGQGKSSVAFCKTFPWSRETVGPESQILTQESILLPSKIGQ